MKATSYKNNTAIGWLVD